MGGGGYLCGGLATSVGCVRGWLPVWGVGYLCRVCRGLATCVGGWLPVWGMVCFTGPPPEDKDENQYHHKQHCNDAHQCHQYWVNFIGGLICIPYYSSKCIFNVHTSKANISGCK